MKGLRSICLLCALLLLTAGFGYSQAVNATLLGTVTDSSGAIVPAAKITHSRVIFDRLPFDAARKAAP